MASIGVDSGAEGHGLVSEMLVGVEAVFGGLVALIYFTSDFTCKTKTARNKCVQ